LATGYFIASNLRVDENILSEIDQLGDGFIMENAYESAEGGGEEEKKEPR
jgi:hypothetical protein